MFVLLMRYLKGYLKICVTSTSPERFLNLCRNRGILLWGLSPKGRDYEMCISVSGFRKLKPVLKKTKTKVVIKERFGLPFFFHKYRKRKMFFCGAAGCAVVVYLLSLFIWNIHIDGNQTRTDETILAFLEEKHTVHGMLRKDVDCEQIVKDIRQQFDDIIWVSAYVKGTRLMIQVKENSDTVTMPATEMEKPSDIVADKDGVVTEIITRKGVPLVHAGDEVKKGDLLVSGRVEVLNDSKEVTGYQYQTADADIFVQTVCPYEETMERSYKEKIYTEKERQKYYLQLSNTKFSVGTTKNQYSHAERHTKEYRWKLGEHFELPVSHGTELVREYRLQKKLYQKEEVQAILSENFHRFCEELEKKGVQILENNVKIHIGQNLAAAKGTLTLIEPAGESRETEIIEVQQKAEGEQ
nr:sporulation protein YqfD [uncultured Faecalimonas sp.]